MKFLRAPEVRLVGKSEALRCRFGRLGKRKGPLLVVAIGIVTSKPRLQGEQKPLHLLRKGLHITLVTSLPIGTVADNGAR